MAGYINKHTCVVTACAGRASPQARMRIKQRLALSHTAQRSAVTFLAFPFRSSLPTSIIGMYCIHQRFVLDARQLKLTSV